MTSEQAKNARIGLRKAFPNTVFQLSYTETDFDLQVVGGTWDYGMGRQEFWGACIDVIHESIPSYFVEYYDVGD